MQALARAVAQAAQIDQHAGACANDSAGFAQHHFDEPRIVFESFRERARSCRWTNAAKRHYAALRLGNDLLRHDHDVARLKLDALAARCFQDAFCKILPATNFRKRGQRKQSERPCGVPKTLPETPASGMLTHSRPEGATREDERFQSRPS